MLSALRTVDKGPIMVMELKIAHGEGASFMSAWLPQELDDAIKAHHAHFFMAQRNLTAEELYEVASNDLENLQHVMDIAKRMEPFPEQDGAFACDTKPTAGPASASSAAAQWLSPVDTS